MDIEYPGFGRIVVDGTTYDHDVVIDHGEVRPRDKGPSRPRKAEFGHTPLTPHEDIPWTDGLVVGSGYSGRLPILIEDEAADRGIDLVVRPTADAVELLRDRDLADVAAILHVTC